MSLKFEDEAAAAHARSAVAGIAVVVATAKHMLNAEAVKWQKLCRRRLKPKCCCCQMLVLRMLLLTKHAVLLLKAAPQVRAACC